MKQAKVPKARKLPSGNWNCVVMVKGVSKSFTGSLKADVEDQALKWKLSQESLPTGTLGDAITRYIEAREKTLSPSTIRRYWKFKDQNFMALQRRNLASLERKDFQSAVNAMSRSYSPKTVKNAWGLLSSVLKENGRQISVKLPQNTSEEHPFLEPEQITEFVGRIKGEELEIPILLGLHGLRRSEIVALTWNDIDLDKNLIRVRGAMVQDKDGLWVQKKETKNESSRRNVPIMIPRLAELLKDSQKSTPHVVTCNPNSIYNAVNRVCEKCGFPAVGAHGLRHSAVSLWWHLGIDEMTSMKLGGYADFATMRKIYTHLASQDMTKATTAIQTFFGTDSETESSQPLVSGQ